MSNKTQKPPSDLDYSQNIQNSFNDVDSTLNVNGFLVGLVGRRIDLSITTTTIANDTENYAFSENGTSLYTFKVVYTDGTRTTMLYALRSA